MAAEYFAVPLTVDEGLSTHRRHVRERLFDIGLVVLLSPFILVIGAVIAVAIYLDSPGPVIFRSVRVGRHGHSFEMFKFRKMRADAVGHPLTQVDDERFTPIGRFLAETRLDELPQVWNVLRGDMRLVGPRPELDCFVQAFPQQYEEILTVTPGITGAAQLEFMGESELLLGSDPAAIYRDAVLPNKIKIDVAYIRSRSFWRDLRIMALTAVMPFRVMSQRLRGGHARLRAHLPALAVALLLVVLFAVSSSSIF